MEYAEWFSDNPAAGCIVYIQVIPCYYLEMKSSEDLVAFNLKFNLEID